MEWIVKNILIVTSVAILMSTSAFSQDCKYKLVVKLDDNGKILSSKTEYVCKESKPILVLPPNTYTETKKVRPPVVSYQDYVNGNYFTNDKGIDFLLNLVYNVN